MASTARSSKGISLSRGPALLVGVVLLVAGLYFNYRVHNYPKFSQFPSGEAHIGDKVFFGIFGVNGWSAELTAAAGGLLLLGAAQHWLAKFTSFLVMVALGGVAIWALVHHHSALGLFAATTWTIVLWGGAAVALFLNLPLPRLTPNTRVQAPAPRPVAPPPPAAPAPAAVAVPAAAPAPAAVAVPAAAPSFEEPATQAVDEPATQAVDEPATQAVDEPATQAFDEPATEVDHTPASGAADEPVTTQMTTEADPPTVERTVSSTAATRTGLAPGDGDASSATSRS